MRKKILDFFDKHRAETGETPTVRKIQRALKISNHRFYKEFPGGIREICKIRGYPLPKDRIKAVEKATKARQATRAAPQTSDEISIEAVKDPKIRKILTSAHKMKAKRDKADAELKAKKLEETYTEEALEKEARLDPEKIADYIRLKDPEWTKELETHCRNEGTTLENVCRILSEQNPPCGEEEDFYTYVTNLLAPWERYHRKAEIRRRHDAPYDPRCECGLSYECMEEEKYNEKGKIDYRYTSFLCPQHQEPWVYHCLVCEELDKKPVCLAYDEKSQTMKCPKCNETWKVKQPLYPLGTFLGGKKPLTTQEQRDAAKLLRDGREQGYDVHETIQKFVEWNRSIKKLKEKKEEAEKELKTLLSEIELKKQIRDQVMHAGNQKAMEYKRLDEDIKTLEKKKARLETEIPPLEARQIMAIKAQLEAEYERQRKPLEEKLKQLDEQIEVKTKLLRRAAEVANKATLLLTTATIASILRNEAVYGEELRNLIEDLTRLMKNPDEVINGIAVHFPKNTDYQKARERMTRMLSRTPGLGDRISDLSLQLAGQWANRVEAERVGQAEQEKARAMNECRLVREESEALLNHLRALQMLLESLENPEATPDETIKELENFIMDIEIRRSHEEYRCRYLTDPSMPKSLIKKIKDEVDTHLDRLINDGEDQPKPT